MPSPFPGMDPWLEDSGLFPDLHLSLTYLVKESLNAILPPGYRAVSKNLVWIDDTQKREPDVSVLSRLPEREAALRPKSYGQLVAVVDPLEETELPYLEILRVADRRLVTAFEILSLSNKSAGSPGRQAYLEKQSEFLDAGVNLLEIDLLRSGKHVSAVSANQVKATVGRPFHYHIAVTVHDPARHFYAAGIHLTDRLPIIGVPLDPADDPVLLDLQAIFDRAYDSTGFGELVNYSASPTPKLSSADQAWATEVLRAKQLVS
jgi:Protein of unknown function (DUF4058)